MIKKFVTLLFLSLGIVSNAFAQKNDAECFQKLMSNTKTQKQALAIFDKSVSALIADAIKAEKKQVALHSSLKVSKILEGTLDVIVKGKVVTEGRGYSIENLNADPSEQVIEPSYSAVFSERVSHRCLLVFNTGEVIITDHDRAVKTRIKVEINTVINY